MRYDALGHHRESAPQDAAGPGYESPRCDGPGYRRRNRIYGTLIAPLPPPPFAPQGPTVPVFVAAPAAPPLPGKVLNTCPTGLNGLLAWWGCHEAGGVTRKDSSGNGNTLTENFTPIAYGAGLYKSAASFLFQGVALSAAVAVGGSSGTYALNDVLTAIGGSVLAGSSASTWTVSGVSVGAVTAVTALNHGVYTTTPANPVATTSNNAGGGSGVGCTLTVTYTGQNLQAGAAIFTAAPFSMAGWVYAFSLPGAVPFGQETGATQHQSFTVQANGAVNFRCGSAGNLVSATGLVVANQWTHLVMTHDGTTLRGYVNGVLVVSGAKAFTAATSFQIGDAALTSSNQAWPGEVQLVGIWNRALTDGGVPTGSVAGGEVAQLYNSGAGLDLFP